MTKQLFLTASLTLAVAAATAPASAQAPLQVIGERTQDDQITERVSHRDLNLANASGQKRLTSRVRSAVGMVCAPLDFTGLRTQRQACRSVAWQGAKPQMARAIARAEQLAASGTTSLPEVAIAVRAPSAF
ncbi:UrcA family protein [uncultured Sphingomonas sp.]|uniref:UrcA family protein n=1 Tax=uncultured Sphingomonas sp. TaxID=158754 RepID=UPI0025F2BCE0|nr:UrcA family protein [uncultured Sphingomonas sp.]